jgi:hypothetical protein
MTEPMTVDEALWHALNCMDRNAGAYDKAAYQAVESLRSRLRQNREAVQKVRDGIAYERSLLIGPGADEYDGLLTVLFSGWLAALDEVLKEGT